MNNVFVFSRSKFKEELRLLNDHQFIGTAFISIHSPATSGHFDDVEVIVEDGPNVLNLWFHDVDPESESLTPKQLSDPELVFFDESMAGKIHAFIEKNIDKRQWIIHCTAGVSRSGAVGEYISDYLENSYRQFKRDNPQIKPNVHVKKLLEKHG